jgi:mannosyltransferase OCH1-like enzyme
MIEKNIHFCWFGPKPISEKNRENIQICKTINPDFTLQLWGNELLDVPDFNNQYVQTCAANGKFANLANYARIYLLKKYGGFYLDIDVRCIKPFSLLLEQLGEVENIYAYESPDNATYINNAVCAATANNSFISKVHDLFLQTFDGSERANISSPHFITSVLTSGAPNVTILPRDYFYPYNYDETFHEGCVTTNTFCIHQWDKNWPD